MTYTDEEIIKALECCAKRMCNYDCPLFEDKDACLHIDQLSLDLIKRQQAELDRLKKQLDDKCDKCIVRDRAEAIKEFSDRLKEKSYPFPCAIGVENAVTIRAINDLVKEMTQEG